MNADSQSLYDRLHASVRWAAAICANNARLLWKAGRRAESKPVREAGREILRRAGEVVPSRAQCYWLAWRCSKCETLLRPTGTFTELERETIESFLEWMRANGELAYPDERAPHGCQFARYELVWIPAPTNRRPGGVAIPEGY